MQNGNSRRLRGFTLIELLVVLAIVALLLSLSLPRYFHSIDNAKETVLRENLRTTRDAIGKFYSDTGRYPEGLEELVQRKYLKTLPLDPILESTSRWRLLSPEGAPGKEVIDLQSGAPGKSLDGSIYSQW